MPLANTHNLPLTFVQQSMPQTARYSVVPLTADQDAIVHSVTSYMNAQCVAAVHMALVKQCAEDRDCIVCHYSADRFKYLLQQLNLWDRHPL